MSYVRLTLAEKFGIATFLAWCAFILLAAAGWVMNIFKIVSLLDGGFTAWMIARIVGVILFPLGAVLGWF